MTLPTNMLPVLGTQPLANLPGLTQRTSASPVRFLVTRYSTAGSFTHQCNAKTTLVYAVVTGPGGGGAGSAGAGNNGGGGGGGTAAKTIPVVGRRSSPEP